MNENIQAKKKTRKIQSRKKMLEGPRESVEKRGRGDRTEEPESTKRGVSGH